LRLRGHSVKGARFARRYRFGRHKKVARPGSKSGQFWM
jgi:hypothetical protein